MITIHGTKQKEETLGLIALAWQDAPVDDVIQIIQPNHLGGKSLEKRLFKLFPDAILESHSKSRYIIIKKTDYTPDIIHEWLDYTRLRYMEETDFYSMPGLFGWNKIDIGSRLLLAHLTDLKGVGSDFGCGYGYLSKNILLEYKKINTIYCFDWDKRAIDACQKNITDDRAIIQQADCSKTIPNVPPLDFIIMNPPFHDGAKEDKALGQKFIETAAHHLKRGGVLWMVANRHLPYEKILASRFHHLERVRDEKGFKIFKAVK